MKPPIFSAWGHASSLLLALCFTSFSQAAVITTCDQAGLEAALAAGGTYTFTCDATINLTNTLVVTKNVSLDGAGHSVVISGNNAVRLFKVSPGVNLTLANLNLTQGAYRGTNGMRGDPFRVPPLQNTPGESAYGGCIYNEAGVVTLTNCVVSNNMVQGGQGVEQFGFSPNPILASAGGTGSGGAIYNSGGTLLANGCTFRDNFATGGPGGPTLPSSAPAGDSLGGAICNSNGILNISNSIFISNLSTGCVSASSAGGSPLAGNGFGGAIHSMSGEVHVASCSFLTNNASGGSSVSGSPGRASGFGGAISCTTNTILKCFTSAFENNAAIGGFGFRHGTATDGKGGALWTQGTTLLKSCTFKDNRATMLGNGDLGGQGQGGAIHTSIGTLALAECLLQENTAEGGRGYAVGFPNATAIGGSGLGGGIYNSGTLLLTNTTVFGNKAFGGTASSAGATTGGSAAGGALFNAAGSVWIVNGTFSQNSATGAQGTTKGASDGGGIHSTNGTVSLFNTILAHSNSGGNCFGALIDDGYNLSSDATCNFSGTGSMNNTDPLLGPLKDNGGPTLTLGLTDCSPALDAANPTVYPPVDQRGVTRPIGTRSDMGACEGIFTWYHTTLTVSSQSAQLTIFGKPAQPFILSSSTDLLNWNPVLTNSLSAGCTFLHSTTNQPHVFYKVVYQQP